MIDLLEILICIMFGVILGFGLKHPALVERERVVRQQLRRAKVLRQQAATDRAIAEDQLRFIQAVRRQTDEMLEFSSRASDLSPQAIRLAATPIFEDTSRVLLSPTAAMPVLEAADEAPEVLTVRVIHDPAPENFFDAHDMAAIAAHETEPEPAEVAEPKGARHQLAKRTKVAVSAMGAQPAEEVLVP